MKKVAVLGMLICVVALAGDEIPFDMTMTASIDGVVKHTVRILEVHRSGQTFTIELFYTPARQSPDQGDLLRGFCTMARGRNESHIRAKRITPMRWEVTFPKSPPIDDAEKLMTVSASQCNQLLPKPPQ